MVPNNTLDLLFNKYKIRKFKNRDIDIDFINMIITAGKTSPSLIRANPWNFYVLSRKSDIQEYSNIIQNEASHKIMQVGIADLLKIAKSTIGKVNNNEGPEEKDPLFHEAPVIVFITSEKSNEWAPYEIKLCAENMILTASSLGIDSCLIELPMDIENSLVYDKLNIKDSEKIMLAIAFGYKDDVLNTSEYLFPAKSYL